MNENTSKSQAGCHDKVLVFLTIGQGVFEEIQGGNYNRLLGTGFGSIVHQDGAYGGTGAAPEIAKKNIAMPIEYAIPRVHRFLENEGIRDEVTLMVSGGLRTAMDVAKAIALDRDLLLAVDGLASYVKAFRRAFRTPLREGRQARPRIILT